MRAAGLHLLWTFALTAACDDAAGHSATVDATTADATSCVTTVACASDSDCTVSPGTRCNTALPVPRCQPLDCGNAGLPCAAPEFCGPALVCFNAAHFGEATVDKSGVCSTPVATRDACKSRCMQAWSRTLDMVFDPCTQQQATDLCLDVCSRYPKWGACESYFTQHNANDFRFVLMSCPAAPLCSYARVTCGTTTTNLEQSNCP